MSLRKIPILFGKLILGMVLVALAISLFSTQVVAAEIQSQFTENTLTASSAFPVFADFEGAFPPGWFVYGDWGNPATALDLALATISDSDPDALPGQVGDNGVLSATVNVPTWAGFGAAFSPVQDWSDYDAVSFWFYGENSGALHEFEIQTVSGDDRRATFVDDFVGWQQIILPFTTFGSGGAYDVTQVDNWVFVLDGTIGSFKLDDLQLVNLQPFADFEGAFPPGWFVYGDWGNPATALDLALATISDSDPDALPGQVGDNGVLSATVNVPTWAGFGAAFSPVQDWSDMQGVSFWFYGENSSALHEFEIQTVSGDDRRATFVDDFVGWQLVTLPFTTFGTPPYDVSQVDNWVFVLDGTIGSFKMDGVGVYGDAGNVTLKTQFDTSAYSVVEGDLATITVTLNMTSTDPVTVTYATADDTAIAGEDYIATSGQLTFSPGVTMQTFSVETLGDSVYKGNRSLMLNLSDPVSVTLGSPNQATLTIEEDDPSNACEIRATTVDDFEDGELPHGMDENDIEIGFFTWVGPNAGTTVTITTTQMVTSTVLQMDSEVFDWGGVSHYFENETADTWVSQDWSSYAAISFWVYGTNSGAEVFFEIRDNRNFGSTTDDSEVFSYPFYDDFSGWKRFEVMFSDFTRKDIGNGAPNDGFTLSEVHGWAFGSTAFSGTLYLDDVQICGYGIPPELEVSFNQSDFEVVEGNAADIMVKLSRSLGEGDPAQISIDYAMEAGTAVVDRDYTPVSGTFTFTLDGPTEQVFSIPTFDNHKHDGDKTVILRLSNPVDIDPGFATQAVLAILDDDPLDPTLLDDFERGAYLWESNNVTLNTPEIAADDLLALPGQGAYEHILQVDTAVLVDIVVNGNICNSGNGVIPVALLTTDSFDALTVDHNTVQFGDAFETHRDKKTGEAKRHEEDFDGDGDLDLVFHFRFNETGYACDSTQVTLTGETFSGQPIVSGGAASFGRDFPIAQDWTRAEALNFWFYGTNSGDVIPFQLKDNRAPDPGPSAWELVWSDEFDDPVGTPPNSNYWSYEIGDGAANRIPGWGNSELEYYTDSTENSAMDGAGNLVITAKESDGEFVCYYGPCEYTSARLISQYKAEFAYGRIESRIRVPQGDGLWPAFWSLGTDIAEVDWPQTGEIDFMEFVGREPYEVFGTIHGPGYSGGQSFGGTYTFTDPVPDDFHTFAIEWEPNLIKWYVDGYLYHTAEPADVAPNEWVFNDPIFIIFNVAVGGNFGGPVGENTTFPQEMVIDYLRVYQGPDTAERWEATFTDNFTGWQQVTIPLDELTRSAEQPVGAPNDGLNLDEVWGYSFNLPEGGTSNGVLRLDQVRLSLKPPVSGIIIDDFEGGLPATWFQYGDYETGTSITPSVIPVSDRPGGVPETSVLSIDYVSAGWGAGTGRDLVPPQDWSAYDGLAFWFYGTDSGTTFELILSDNKSDPNADTAERFHATFTDDFAGWQHVSLPWSVFYRGAWQPPGAPDDGLTLTEMWAYALALPVGTSGTFYLDDIALFKLETVEDFETGVPATWFQYGDYDNGANITTSGLVVNDRPGGVPDTSVLSIDYVSEGWGAGTGQDLIPPQDWSAADGLAFWFFGTNSGTTFELILSDNKSDPNADTAERFHATFTDDFAGWQHVSLPWSVFYRGSWQPPGAPDDGLTLTEVWAYALALPIGTSGTFYLDDVALVK